MRVRPKHLLSVEDKIKETAKKLVPLFSDDRGGIDGGFAYQTSPYLAAAYQKIMGLENGFSLVNTRAAADTLFAVLDELYSNPDRPSPQRTKTLKAAAILGELSFYCPTFRPEYIRDFYPEEIIVEFEKGQRIAYAENQGSKLGLYGAPLLGAGALVAFLASAPISVVALLGVLALASPYAGEFLGRKGPGLFNNHNPVPAPAPAPAPVNYGAIPTAFSGPPHRL